VQPTYDGFGPRRNAVRALIGQLSHRPDCGTLGSLVMA
jgi:hypothetical protein